MSNCEKNACANYIRYLDKMNDKMDNVTRKELDKVNNQLKSKNLSDLNLIIIQYLNLSNYLTTRPDNIGPYQ